MRLFSRRKVIAGGALLGSLLVAGCLGGRSVVDETTETIALDGAGSVAVQAEAGDVTVRSGDRDDVRVVARRSAGSEDELERVSLDVAAEGDRIDLTVERSYEEAPLSPPTMDLDVTLPSGVRLAEAETGAGELDVSGVAGPTSLRVGSGGASVDRVDGSVEIDGGSGDVAVREVGGPVAAAVGSGSLTAALGSRSADATLEAGSGDLSLTAAESVDATVSLSPGSGSVSASGVDLRETDDAFVATLGEGTHRVDAATGSGDIELTVDDG